MSPLASVALFWSVVILAVAAALALVLVPLLRGRRQAPRAAKPALARGLVWALVILIPALTVGGYLLIGTPAATRLLAEARALIAEPVDGHDVDKLLRQVEERVRANPGDGNAWALMGKTYATLERWDEAAMAYQRASQLLPGTAAVLSGYAEALAVRNGRLIKGEPMELVYKALELDPQDAKALELAALHAYEEGNFAQAAYYFKSLLKGLEPGSRYALDVEAVMTEAKRRAHLALNPADGAQPSPAATARIRGSVDLAPALRERAGARGTIVLTARAPEGGEPLVTLRAPATNFPIPFELNDAMVIGSERGLAALGAVTLAVRFSPSGALQPAAGDLEGTLSGVKVGAADVRLVIDRVRP